MTDRTEAFKIVYDELVNRSNINLFKGKFDAVNGSETYMYGIGLVLEWIAYQVSEETYDQFLDLFYNNLGECIEEAEMSKEVSFHD